MQYTTNYNLITVEGTDVVNPLVQMNPNFTDIDTAMFANKQAVIGTATEITVGTVHSITRANTDSNYFRFTATSNWTTGDSMNVDGVAVSVYLTDGTVPGTGSYVINSEVFGIITGSRVTLYLASSPVTSLPADQITFDPTGTGYNPADTDVDKVLKEIDGQINKGSVTVYADGVKTWSSAMNELFALIDNTKIDINSRLRVGTTMYQAISESLTEYDFNTSVVTGTKVYINELSIKSAASIYRSAEIGNGTLTIYDFSTNVLGDNITLVY